MSASNNYTTGVTASTSKTDVKSSKSSLDKGRQKEVKARLNAEASREIRPLAVGTVAMMASALANQALPKLLGKLLDEKTSSLDSMTCGVDKVCSSSSNSTSASKILAVVVIGGGLASFLRTTMLNRAQDNIAKRLRTKLFGRDAAKKGEASTSISPGAIGSVLTEDITKASESVSVTFANVIRSCSSCTFATYHMLSINPSLFGISVSIVPIVGAAAVVLNKFVKKATTKQRECAELAASFAEERINHIETVKLSNRENDEVEEYVRLQEECAQLGRKVSSAKGTFMGFMFAASGSALYMVFNAGGKAIADGRMTSGELTSFATYSFLLGLGTSGVFKALGERTQGLVCADRIYKLMDGTDATTTSDKKRSVKSIAVEKVSFAYKNSPDKKVLSDVTLSLQRGKVVALVGKNGSGKSSLASVISGLYAPQNGMITVQPGRENFHDLNRQSQSALVQVVPQHPALFDTSIRANIVYSKPTATDDQVEKVLELSNCTFISKLEGGLDFVVGRNGMRLSGGERQRIALARSLLSDPCLLILDEPTSAMDAEGEGAVMDAVHACRDGDGNSSRGLLLITHRASTLKVADLIVVLKDGKIVEQGTFDTLSASKDSELCELMAELL
ncbi:ABC transporter [Thalassiosira pseudonana CCMP1335]|uniref:ABC transporter n=1 Tax=Thalassiosira pseudonana TaxID=35128 RepID=B8C0B8_THAPS|nr:ABC transporter [Thalassiosira pseudonana CCMP1335]EED93036.1 ABC transporter [Thalassiosira pseudonana CCMP1335]